MWRIMCKCLPPDHIIPQKRIDNLGKRHEGPKQPADPSAANDADMLRPMREKRLIGGCAPGAEEKGITFRCASS